MLSGPIALRRAALQWRQKPCEAVLDRIAAMVQESVVFQAAEFDGIFAIDPRSHLLRRFLQFGFYEPETARLFVTLVEPGKDVLDIGANVGFFTVAAAKKLTTGRLLAAEPTQGAFSRLEGNVKRNGVSERVILFKGMIGSASGEAEIHVIPGLEEYSSASGAMWSGVQDRESRSETVPVASIDDLVKLHALQPALMKVDTEGAEYSVFSGAAHTLSTYRPVVFSEIWRKPQGADEIIRMFKDMDYVVKNPVDPQATPGQEEIDNIVCIPREKYSPSVFSFAG